MYLLFLVEPDAATYSFLVGTDRSFSRLLLSLRVLSFSMKEVRLDPLPVEDAGALGGALGGLLGNRSRNINESPVTPRPLTPPLRFLLPGLGPK